jgi:hypothetical protein
LVRWCSTFPLVQTTTYRITAWSYQFLLTEYIEIDRIYTSVIDKKIVLS